MEQLLLTIFSEKGIIYGLFVLSFYLIIYKGVPYGVKKVEETLSESRRLQRETHEFFKQELSKISETFVGEIKSITEWQQKSNDWHTQHGRQLEEIKNLIKTKD